jgi:hypothetical protein
MAALAAVLVVVAIVGARMFIPTGPSSSGSPSPTTSGETATAIPSATHEPTASPTDVATPTTVSTPSSIASPSSNPTFTTDGVATNWRGFTWSPIRSGSPDESPLAWNDFYGPVVQWAHGYAMIGLPRGDPLAQGLGEGVWTSPDGMSWTRTLMAPYVQVAEGPSGLVAITAGDVSESADQTAWSSSDGIHWTNIGTPSGLDGVASLGGTVSGLVAISRSGSGQDKVVFSTDGPNWSPVTVESGLQWDESGPLVQAGNGRFFLMGGLPANAARDQGAFRLLSSQQGTPVLLWSDDGRTWHRSGPTGYYGTGIDFGRDGIILHTTMRLIPGGTGLALSTDGGKTWQGQAEFSPLGYEDCSQVQGECSTGPDGVIGSNGSLFVAVKSDGHAWTSYDGKKWTTVAWSGPSQPLGLVVLPRGVIVNGQYGAAR